MDDEGAFNIDEPILIKKTYFILIMVGILLSYELIDIGIYYIQLNKLQ